MLSLLILIILLIQYQKIQDKNYLVEVLATDLNQDTDVLIFEIDGYSVEVDNPYYFSFEFIYENQSDKYIEILFNQNLSKDYKKFISVEPELDLDVDQDAPGYLMINTDNWVESFYKVTFEPGFFSSYNQPKTFVLEKQSRNSGFQINFQC